MLKRLSISQIIKNIKTETCFEADSIDGSFTIKVKAYEPYICAAIHNGHGFRDELTKKCALSEFERWYEEDPYTGSFIKSFPITLIANDSRYEYDLNRSENECIYNSAWGKQVWKNALNKKERETSLKKYKRFYEVVDALVQRLEENFNACLVFDFHSYNYKRLEKEAPVFNLGSELQNHNRFRPVIDSWLNQLSQIELPNIKVEAKENDVFQGRGHFSYHLTQKFKNTLVFPTEIKKVYCDELTGEKYPMVIKALSDGFKTGVTTCVYQFARKHTNLKIRSKARLLSPDPTKSIIKIDNELYKLVRHFEVLNYVNPINTEQEKKRFFSKRYSENPVFKYKQIIIDPFDLKRRLYKIPVEQIDDISIQQLYKDVVTSFADKIDLLASLGEEKFLYNSLRYFGEPRESDVRNASFIIHASDSFEPREVENITDAEAITFFKEFGKQHGLNFKIEQSSKIVSKALVNNVRKTLVIKKGAKFSEIKLHALAHHEIGVHIVTTLNAVDQPLKVFRLGMPRYTHTQEGLAVLSEFLTGNINLRRLKVLALRVIAIQLMLKGEDFRKTFQILTEEYNMDSDAAFYLVARTFRGGGFTKDYLYLRGFRDVLELYKSGKSLNSLFVGKTSLTYLSTINEMIERKIIQKPTFENTALRQKVQTSPILDYLLEGLN